MEKSAQLAKNINAHIVGRPANYKKIADSIALEIGVGIYWLGTASDYCGRAEAQVFQLGKNGKWGKQLGSVYEKNDGSWAHE